MWPFKSTKKSEPKVEEPQVPGQNLAVKGQTIFQLLEFALKHKHNLRVIPGTGSLGWDRWGDGGYYYRVRVETDTSLNIRVYIDGVPMELSVWNDLTNEAKQEYCKNHTVTLKYSENL